MLGQAWVSENPIEERSGVSVVYPFKANLGLQLAVCCCNNNERYHLHPCFYQNLQIAEQLGYLPLAVNLAAAYISEMDDRETAQIKAPGATHHADIGSTTFSPWVSDKMYSRRSAKPKNSPIRKLVAPKKYKQSHGQLYENRECLRIAQTRYSSNYLIIPIPLSTTTPPPPNYHPLRFRRTKNTLIFPTLLHTPSPKIQLRKLRTRQRWRLVLFTERGSHSTRKFPEWNVPCWAHGLRPRDDVRLPALQLVQLGDRVPILLLRYSLCSG